MRFTTATLVPLVLALGKCAVDGRPVETTDISTGVLVEDKRILTESVDSAALLINFDDSSTDTSSSSSSSSSSTSVNAVEDSSASIKTNSGAIIGGVFGGAAAFFAVAFCLGYWSNTDSINNNNTNNAGANAGNNATAATNAPVQPGRPGLRAAAEPAPPRNSSNGSIYVMPQSSAETLPEQVPDNSQEVEPRTLTAEEFDRLPRQEYNAYYIPLFAASTSASQSPLAADEQTGLKECTICYDAYEHGQSIIRLPCIHAFHKSCIETWLIEQQGLCPICQTSVLRYL